MSRPRAFVELICALVGIAPLIAHADDPFVTLHGIDDTTLQNVESRPDDWLSHGRDAGETRFSPLTDINADNVHELGLAWSYSTQTERGLEATPLVVDGVIYTTGSWSRVYAIDAQTGNELWKYDPEVEGKYGARACCDVVNRGVAVYKGRVYVGALDGRLISLDCKTGKPIWQTVTVDQERPYTITGAPRIANGKVLIGNGGADYGVRGYVSAYDWETGEMVWRFYTVPGDPSKGFESPAMERAAETWSGQWWEIGGGGTCWDSMAFDPDLNLVYVGVGNGSPWNPKLRSDGSGDNLYLSSIVALDADTGKLAWHYQTTPAEAWDFTATQHMILTELTISGRRRKVIMQAPKNGFFYVLDRATGELLSAKPYVKVTWAEGIDPQTGRPIVVPGARYEDEDFLVVPGPLGGHNWQPMSYSPKTGLVYIPAQSNSLRFSQPEKFEYRPGLFNFGIGAAPPDPNAAAPTGFLLAWDPVAQEERWRKPYSLMWNGGTLATAGNIVFQGTADGRFVAYHAEHGENLWEINVGGGIIATPVTYRVDGVQYVSIMAGWGGIGTMFGGLPNQPAGRLLTFVLRGEMKLPTATAQDAPVEVSVIATDGDAASAQRGQREYVNSCRVCHGDPTSGTQAIPSLALSDESVFDMYDEIVFEGELIDNGMPGFKQWLTKEQIADIRHFLITQRNQIASANTRQP